eukprot:1883901-Rhodomonas_salina.2
MHAVVPLSRTVAYACEQKEGGARPKSVYPTGYSSPRCPCRCTPPLQETRGPCISQRKVTGRRKRFGSLARPTLAGSLQKLALLLETH